MVGPAAETIPAADPLVGLTVVPSEIGAAAAGIPAGSAAFSTMLLLHQYPTSSRTFLLRPKVA